MPVTSPIAHSRSPARRCASTGTPWASGSMPTRLQADAVHARAPAGGDEQAVAAQLAAVVEGRARSRRRRAARRSRARRGRARCRRGAAPRPAPRRAARARGRARASAPSTSDDLAAEAAHGLGHLDAHRPAAEHEQPTRDGLHAGRLAVGPDPVEVAQARDRRDERVRPAGEHDVVGGVAHAVDLDRAGSGEPARAAQQVDAVARQPALLPGVGVVGDHEVPPRQRRVDVDLRGRRRLARAVHGLAGPQQRLRRDARPVRALAPDQLALDDGDTQPAVGERAGAVLPGRARAQDDDVVVVAHGELRWRWS